MTAVVDRTDVARGLRQLELEDTVVCVHSSLRSFGSVVGGAAAVVEGLLASGMTVLVPTFSREEFAIPPPADMRPQRNGCDYATYAAGIGRAARTFTTASQALDANMGAIPAAVLAHPERRRGDHPLCSFTAVGPLAASLVADQRADDVYAPLDRLAAVGGWVLLVGVGLDRLTLLHLAEKRAGRRLFRRWALDAHGRPAMCEMGGCSSGFGSFLDPLEPLRRTTTVGASSWSAYPAAATLTVAADAIRRDPEITRCVVTGCVRCADAIAGGPLLTA